MIVGPAASNLVMQHLNGIGNIRNLEANAHTLHDAMLRTCRNELAVGLLGDTGLAMAADIPEDVAVDGRRGRGIPNVVGVFVFRGRRHPYSFKL